MVIIEVPERPLIAGLTRNGRLETLPPRVRLTEEERRKHKIQAEIYIPKASFLETPFIPTEADLNIKKIWGAMVRNVGTAGEILFGIGNRLESPGDFELYCSNTGTTGTVIPGKTRAYYGPVEAGSILGGMGGLAGQITFKSEGIYYLIAYISHKDASGWVVDDAVNVTVTVGDVAPPPDEDPHSTLEDYTFPIEAVVGALEPWATTVHNIGGTGLIGAEIFNTAGNPGNITIEYGGELTQIIPGRAFRIYAEKPNCTRLSSNGKIKFASVGDYDMRIRAVYQVGGSWWYMDEEMVTVTITEEEEPPEDKTIIEEIIEWWNNLEQYKKATMALSVVGLLLMIRPRYPPPNR